MAYETIREEELKNRIAQDYFGDYDCAKIIGNVDFCVSVPQVQSELYEHQSLLWAEAKKGKSDIFKSIVQLILTIGRARTFDKNLPPAFLGAFDAEKIAFVPYNDIHEIFYLNDFNWNVTPSNYETKEFILLHSKVKSTIEQNALQFDYQSDNNELKTFIATNFIVGKLGLSKINIDKNNFIIVYNKWLQSVKPTISVNWEMLKKKGIIDGDFYLADLLSLENETLKEKLYVLLKKDIYELDRITDESGLFSSKRADFTDKQKAHTQFWNKYQRPPKEEYWDYIVNRRDLLVPQDIRERKGSFYTPQIWVELSQKYLTDVLGEDWQDEYYIWDCAAGTGNLLAGLINKYHVFASTLDRQDVDVMKDRIKNGANLLEENVFQFDFLNDDFTKIPKDLQNIINDSEKRKKLVIYINPPYVESNGKTSTNRSNVQTTKIHANYFSKLEKVGAELFAQFLARIYFEIPDCIIAQFSTLKVVSASNSKTFRTHFLAKLEKLFLVPATTFDNVKGSFPIGFFIWNTSKKEKFTSITAKVFDVDGKFSRRKKIYSYDNEKGRINDWLNTFKNKEYDGHIGILMADAPDFQNNNYVAIQNEKTKRHGIYFSINQRNLIQVCIYLSVRQVFKATWTNDRDQFLYPNKKWEKDIEFQNDCLSYTMFHGQNKISSILGINHWIPFTEYEVNSRKKFESNFMTDYIAGKIKREKSVTMFETEEKSKRKKLEFSAQAQAVFEAGKALWSYYHQEPNCDVNASFYDIREHFQGRNEKGKMNHKSEDENYMKLIKQLREQLQNLETKLQPKVYEYGFLKE